MACIDREGGRGNESHHRWDRDNDPYHHEERTSRDRRETQGPSDSRRETQGPSDGRRETQDPSDGRRKTQDPSGPKPTETSPAPTSGAGAPAPARGSRTTSAVVELVNNERAKAGCAPLSANARLTKAAQDHSEDMAARRTMSHQGSDGSSPGARITRAGYTWSTYGENVAYGYPTPERVMAGWMSSPGHKRNILNCKFKEIGVGLAPSGFYWTQNFATAR
jgi:uncharacterized protein YkwD